MLRTTYIPRGVIEQKQISVLNGGGALNTGTIQQVSQIDATLGRDGRVGNRITIKNIRVRGTLAINTAGVSVQSVRIMVVCDKQQVDNNVPILSGAGGILETASSLSDYSLDQPDRFYVAYDQLWSLNKIDYTSPKVDISVNCPKYLTTQFASNLGTSIAKNGWYLVIVGDVAVNGATFNLNTRVSWTDY